MSDAIDREGANVFVPHPDAHAETFASLLSPVRKAVEQLLYKLDGALYHAAAQKAPPNTNCFLVHGDRGTGKTTVPLNAKAAVHSDFHRSSAYWEPNESSLAHHYAARLADRRVMWLDILDLEPLPPGANLLTMLVTRIRDVWDEGTGRVYRSDAHEESSSLFAENDRSARVKLQQLVSDASLMWEEITESDTRSVASRRATAAEIYARFRENFADAIETAAKELYHHVTGAEGKCVLVLPIDNIDRSVEHLAAMVRLAALVSCRHLWLVMAGDRVDLDTFLERAYWKELIRVGAGAGGSGKVDPQGEDEAFVMARRQSAAASQKLLPQSHRIEVSRVSPRETLKFKLLASGPSIVEMLNQMKLARGRCVPPLTAPSQSANTPPIGAELVSQLSLTDLMQFESPPTSADRTATLTTAGQFALTLPARNVIDLWQLANDVIHGLRRPSMKPEQARWNVASDGSESVPTSEELHAEQVARTMLRQAISMSTMSSDLGRRLQDQIIDRTPEGGTVLNFSRWRLDVHRYREWIYEFEIVNRVPHSVRSNLTFFSVKRLIQEIVPRDQSLGNLTTPWRNWELPDIVSGWMAVMHDLAIWSNSSTVVRSEIATAPLVCVRHASTIEPNDQANSTTLGPRAAPIFSHDHPGDEVLELHWPAPEWNLFVAHNAFREHWTSFQELVASFTTNVAQATRHLAFGWIRCSVQTFLAYATRLSPEFEDQETYGWHGIVDITDRDRLTPRDDMELAPFEIDILKWIERLYCQIESADRTFSLTRQGQCCSWMLMMRSWLKWELPLFRWPLLVPRSNSDVASDPVWKAYDAAWSTYAPSLTKWWQENDDLILSETVRRIAGQRAKQHGSDRQVAARETDVQYLGHLVDRLRQIR